MYCCGTSADGCAIVIVIVGAIATLLVHGAHDGVAAWLQSTYAADWYGIAAGSGGSGSFTWATGGRGMSSAHDATSASAMSSLAAVTLRASPVT
jgi:hypothetical protein